MKYALCDPLAVISLLALASGLGACAPSSQSPATAGAQLSAGANSSTPAPAPLASDQKNIPSGRDFRFPPHRPKGAAVPGAHKTTSTSTSAVPGGSGSSEQSGQQPSQSNPAAPVAAESSGFPLADGERLISILGTNDIHGAVEEQKAKDGTPQGGLAAIAGIAQAIRDGLKAQFGSRAGTLLVDSGDQFQGTLISNYNEGVLVFSAMNEAGYDAVIPGNHDYDFGPIGWQVDQDPSGAVNRDSLMRLKAMAKFPLLSANTYFKSSLGVAVDGNGCKPKDSTQAVDWSKGQRPDFLTPYLIKQVAGVRVALIGIDNSGTSTMTTAANVSDLCFRDEAEAYLDIRRAIEKDADVFVVLMHNGNAAGTDIAATQFVQKVLAARPGGVDAVMAGHTHYVNDLRVQGVPIVQTGANGLNFARVDLVWDTNAGKLVAPKTRQVGAAAASLTRCNEKPALDYCQAVDGGVVYEGVQVKANAAIADLVRAEREKIKPLADKKLGEAQVDLKTDYTEESPLADVLTDALRTVSGAQIAFMNTGGIRAPILAGTLTYEAFYRILPFNNHGVIVAPMKVQTLGSLLSRSIRTCGAYGALMQSGLRVTYERDCNRAVNGIDKQAKLSQVETLDGKVLITDGKAVDETAEFQVATLDFLSTGGSGFTDFAAVPQVKDLGIVRELMVDQWAKTLPVFGANTMDGRWKNALSQ